MTRDPLAVARDLACLPRGARSAIRRPWLPPDPAPPAPCLRSGACDGRSRTGGWPIRRHPVADPAPADGRSRHRRMADPAPADGRSGDIRWPIPHRRMADQATSGGRSRTGGWPIRRHPVADPAPADGRSGDIRWPIPHRRMADQATSGGRSRTGGWPIRRHPVAAIRCLRCDQARSRTRDPPPAIRDPRVWVPLPN
jgi:hypothetical protein